MLIQNTLGRHASHYQNKHKPLAYIPCHNNHLFKVLVWMMSVPAGLSDFRLSKHNQYTYNSQVNDSHFPRLTFIRCQCTLVFGCSPVHTLYSHDYIISYSTCTPNTKLVKSRRCQCLLVFYTHDCDNPRTPVKSLTATLFCFFPLNTTS